MNQIKKTGILSIGLYAALISVIVLLINMAVTAIISGLANAYPSILDVLYWNTTLTQIVLTVVIAFITWTLIACIYNLVVKKLSGIKVELSETSKKKKK